MNLHEYQAKEVLKKFGVPVPDFHVVSNKEEVDRAIDELQLDEAVIKIQVHAGGRGKAGGVKFAKGRAEIEKVAQQLIGLKIVNEQTGPQGITAYKVMISRPIDIKKEYYIGAVIDRESALPILIASPEGGMEIEEIAETHPEKILRLPIELDGTIKPYRLVYLAKFMGWEGDLAKQGIQIAKALAEAFIKSDGSLLEINPLVETPNKEILALDAKLAIDDNALFRQKELAACFDPTQVSKSEVEAKEFDLSYIALDGNIGCMVNGAGLAMATMDIIKFYGGQPANFLDVGGSATKEQVSEAFKIILFDPQVKALLINIFGGIMNCATLADGIVHAAKEQKLTVPLIIRMEGTNVKQGKQTLKSSGLSIITADSLAEAAQKAVEALKG